MAAVSETTSDAVKLDASGAVTLRDDPSKLLRSICLWSLGIPIGIAILLSGPRGLWPGFFCIVYAIYRVVEVMRHRRGTKPALVLSAEGLDDRWLGVGPIPWRYINAATLKPPGSLIRPESYFIGQGVYIEKAPIIDWVGATMSHDWMARITKGSDRVIGGRIAVARTGGNRLGISPDDLLWLISRYVPVEGLSPNYQPAHPALQALAAAPAAGSAKQSP